MVTEYTHIHFDVEEGFLRNSGFTDFKKHQECLILLIRRPPSVALKSLLGHNPQEFLEFLKNWWIEHICEKDRIFRDYLFNEA
jgi:hemerythrin